MNAPARFPVIPSEPTIGERAHRHSISVHCPGCSEAEMAARCDIAALRDAATAGALRATESAAVVLGEAARIATAAVFAPASVSRLIRTRGALEFMMDTARVLERLSRDG